MEIAGAAAGNVWFLVSSSAQKTGKDAERLISRHCIKWYPRVSKQFPDSAKALGGFQGAL
jgi:hypothetical protein